MPSLVCKLKTQNYNKLTQELKIGLYTWFIGLYEMEHKYC